MKYARSFLIGALVLSACSSSALRTNGGGTGGEEETGGGGGSTSTGGKTATGGSPGTGGASTGGSTGTGGASTGGSTGTGGQAATGGSTGTGGSVAPDAGSTPDSGATADAGAALMECPKPSIDRITAWNATGEGTTKPMSGSLLVKEGDHYVAKQEFVGGGWHVLEVFVANAYGASADLTNDATFTLTYSSTAELWLQMRASNHYSGGAQWVTKIPSTGGQKMTATFSLDPGKWTTIELGKPSWTYAEARQKACGFVFVGDKPNVISFWSLRFEKYVPMCK
jgi:hypothetical protein